jgi:thioredoxin reductase (NADPH)
MFDIIIIGAGPAGMTAAIYALRAGKKVLIIEKENFGGQITASPRVENYPGFKSISGNEFADNLLDQITSLGVVTEVNVVTAVKKTAGTFTVETESGNFEGRAVIIATGVSHRRLQVNGEEEHLGKGISFCAVCDGGFYRNKDVAVVGGGSTALQDSLFLSDICSKVYLIHRRDQFRGETELSDEVRRNPKIELCLNSTVDEIKGLSVVESVVIRNKIDNSTREISVKGVFEAVGQIPENRQFADVIELDEAGYIKSDEKCLTSCEGIFAAGDCRTKERRQLTTATADGTIAALAALDYIRIRSN